MTALDNWLLLCKITLFLELIEYAVVLQVKFSNATLTNLRKMTKRKKQTISTERRSEEEADKLITAKCKKIDSGAFIVFLLGSIFTNFVYFTYYW